MEGERRYLYSYRNTGEPCDLLLESGRKEVHDEDKKEESGEPDGITDRALGNTRRNED